MSAVLAHSLFHSFNVIQEGCTDIVHDIVYYMLRTAVYNFGLFCNEAGTWCRALLKLSNKWPYNVVRIRETRNIAEFL